MAQSPSTISADEVAKMFDLDLKNRSLAALLAWLVPGLGHLYQGRTAKGLLLMICITTTFAFGFYLGGGKVAYATPLTVQKMADQTNTRPNLRHRFTQAIDRWPFFCQAGIGTVAIPAVIERQRYLAGGDAIWPGRWFFPPRDSDQGPFGSEGSPVQHPTEIAKWQYDGGFYFEVGTIYTVIAGLLNILAVYDAYSGPLIPAPQKPKDNDGKEGESGGDDKPPG